MRQLITFALRQRVFVVGGVLTLIAGGLFALTHVPFDAFPDLTGTRVEVITTAPGLAPEEVERLVTYPLESSLMAAYSAAVVALDAAGSLQTAASILASHAQHRVRLRSSAGLDPLG